MTALESVSGTQGPFTVERSFSNRFFRWLVENLGALFVAVLGVLAWWVASVAFFVVPSPVETLNDLIAAIGDSRFQTNMRVTAVAVMWSVIASIVVGVIFGLAFGVSEWLTRAFEPLIIALNGLPKIVLYPVLLLILGMGDTSKIVLATSIGMFPVFMNVAAGVRDMPPVYRRVARSLDATRMQTFFQVVLPAIRRPLLTGVRLAVSLATVGVVLGEMFATQYGLGRVILASHSAGQNARMFATVMLLLGVSFVISSVLWRIERHAK